VPKCSDALGMLSVPKRTMSVRLQCHIRGSIAQARVVKACSKSSDALNLLKTRRELLATSTGLAVGLADCPGIAATSAPINPSKPHPRDSASRPDLLLVPKCNLTPSVAISQVQTTFNFLSNKEMCKQGSALQVIRGCWQLRGDHQYVLTLSTSHTSPANTSPYKLFCRCCD
jgi:hypothetical protein